MTPTQQYPFLNDLLSPFESRRQKTMALCIAAIAATGQARSFAIATTMSRWGGTLLQSAINRFYRLLRNGHIDEQTLVAQWVTVLCRNKSEPLLIGIDWTEWSAGLRLLVAAVVVGKRAIPVCVRGFTQKVWRGSQNRREHDFLRLLSAGLHQAGLRATLLCDRGFRRVSWLLEIDKHKLGFAVRLMDDVHVLYKGEKVPLGSIQLSPRQMLDLGKVALRVDGLHSFRVIGFRSKGSKDPWWIATNLDDSPWKILSFYDRRMTIEEQFRDLKGKRFGVKLGWTQFRKPEQLARFIMLLAIALLIWTTAGRLAVSKHPSLRLVCKKKGPRQSYTTIGLREIVDVSTQKPFSLRLIRFWIEPPTLRALYRNVKGGK